MSRRLPLLATLLVAAAVLTMIGLGVWQLQRAGEKKALLARYEAAQGLPAIAFPMIPIGEDLPLFRQASGHCLRVISRRTGAGENLKGETGFTHIADCGSGAEGPGMAVELGWSKDPNAGAGWKGGEVRGIIAPDSRSRMRLVSSTGLGGLEASKPPSPASIPNNHLSYAIQWFLFALLAALIYGLALRKRWSQEEATP
jgi:cytochrome oxidase assembly protein ShyY1